MDREMAYRVERLINGVWVLSEEEYETRTEAVALMRRLLESGEATRGQIQVVDLIKTDGWKR